MTAILEQVPEQYVAEEALRDFVGIVAHVADEVTDGLGYNLDNVTIGDTKLWARFNPDDKPGLSVELADARASLLTARLFRYLLDEPDLLRERAAAFETTAAKLLAKHLAEGGHDG